jgi:hypothetical protein
MFVKLRIVLILTWILPKSLFKESQPLDLCDPGGIHSFNGWDFSGSDFEDYLFMEIIITFVSLQGTVSYCSLQRHCFKVVVFYFLANKCMVVKIGNVKILNSDLFNPWLWQVYSLQWIVAADHPLKREECYLSYLSSQGKLLTSMHFVTVAATIK